MGQSRFVRGVSTDVYTEHGVTNVSYHGTRVVRFDSKQIILDTGGWFTATTKLRMNQASNQFDLGYQVYQQGGDRYGGSADSWFVSYNGVEYPFTGNVLVLEREV